MKKNNQNGFTLILSMVLLLVMSLMGGALIVISSGDHQSNNTSDQYQQTFYVAEHALIEAEKRIVNRMIGTWTEIATIATPPVGSTATEITEHNNYIDQLRAIAINGLARDTDRRDIPRNLITPVETPCFQSFRNLIRKDGGGDLTLVTDHFVNVNFGNLIEPILNNPDDVGLAVDDAEKETEYLKRFRYEFFSINVGASTFKGAGGSLKKTSTNVQRQGTSYRIYGCGYLMPNGADLDEYEDPEILIPLETLVVLSS
ncbi:MAG: pilus assembly protein PilZ [Euryarchaeota archaeon]|nr:pilus assembly protein PilZ [Euryarchaeota archaeon]|tara:strand:+ start:95 stop:868 length:774 start_codon:yes stop_codon:yes gene_type:complete